MVEGGGLGVFRPEEIGPIKVMQANGTIDVLVEDEAAAVKAAKQYIGYFQGPLAEWTCADQRLFAPLHPGEPAAVYDVRAVIALIGDTGSVLELRPKFGLAMITAFIRVEGRPLGVIANNPHHLGGAIDSDASDKAARFMQLCEAFDIPILSLSDTPGNMVGPEAEKTGLIRHCSRLFVIGANLTVADLLGDPAQKLRPGRHRHDRRQLSGGHVLRRLADGRVRRHGPGGVGQAGLPQRTGRHRRSRRPQGEIRRDGRPAYAGGKALARGAYPPLDDVIDPADTRRWVVSGLKALPPVPVARKRNCGGSTAGRGAIDDPLMLARRIGPPAARRQEDPSMRLISVAALLASLATQAAAPARAADTPAPVVVHYGAWGVDLTSGDKSVKPGDDFYAYADGAWDAKAVIPPDQGSAGFDARCVQPHPGAAAHPDRDGRPRSQDAESPPRSAGSTRPGWTRRDWKPRRRPP